MRNSLTLKLTNAGTLWNLTMGLAIVVYIVGLFVNLMEPDAVTYAIIPMEMVQRNNYLELYSRGIDWLDKPHFQFWMTAISYNVFGINNISFKLPAIIFTLIGVKYTFLYGRRFYNKKVGWIACIILVTSLHLILSNNDVRAEPFLLGLTIFSLYYFARYMENNKWKFLLAGSFGLGCLMMTKGLFTIIPVVAGIFFSLLYAKDWKGLFNWRWLISAMAAFAFTVPVLYSYYVQFDLQPDKQIFGQTNVSGINFFLWDSQWGRFMNTGPIKGEGDLFFFFHTILWAFAPWAILAYFALYKKASALIRGTDKNENLTFFGFGTLFIILSVSSFQLPHYIVPLFPLLSIISSKTLVDISRKPRVLRAFTGIHAFLLVLLILIAIALNHAFTGTIPSIDTLAVTLLVISTIIWIYKRSVSSLKKILFPVALSTLLVMYFMNRDFYPKLLKYQSESEVAIYMLQNNIPSEDLVSVGRDQWATEFYLQRVVPVIPGPDLHQFDIIDKYAFSNDAGLASLTKNGYTFEIVESFDDFHVTTMTGTFINRNTRNESLSKTYLLKILP